VRAVFASPPSLVAGTAYKACVFYDNTGGVSWYSATSHYWDTGPGSSGIVNGPLSAPSNAASATGQDSFNTPGSSISNPGASFNATNYWVDPEISLSAYPDLSISLTGTTGHVSTYTVTSAINDTGGIGPQDTRVLTPDSPSGAFGHGFLWLLPVEPGQGTTFGDGIATIQALNAQNQYNLTCIQPGFPVDPWYADNPDDPATQQEKFMLELVAWAKANLATTGNEEHYLIGFSKSGSGGQQLFWHHPDIFQAVASWDFPADQTFSEFGSDSAAVYGDQANFDNNYALTSAHLTAWKANTGTVKRVWIGAGVSFDGQVADFDTLLTSLGILHTYSVQTYSEHNWAPTPSWVAPALAAMLPIPAVTGTFSLAIQNPAIHLSAAQPVTGSFALEVAGPTIRLQHTTQVPILRARVSVNALRAMISVD
jgi:hypothetical protein